MTLEAGRRLLHYRLIEKIGEGGMGVVWKAEDTKLRRLVALKLLPESMAADPDRRARFEREARAVAALSHPNIVTVHSVEEVVAPEGSVHFLTMELIEGHTLRRLLPDGGFPVGRLLEIAIPLADAVSRAHRAGITHRDLKPDNVMIDRDGRLRVLDFGLAKLREPGGRRGDTQASTVTSDTSEGRLLGTVAYMSPEQAEGKDVDPRSDVFSLGTILYEMATGSRPFRGTTAMSTIGAILKDVPEPVTERNPSLPRHLGRIVRRCLAKDPERRYQTALDLRNDLDELRSEIVSENPAAVSLAPSPSPRRAARFRWGLVAVAVVALALTLPRLRWLQRERRHAAYAPVPITSTINGDGGASWSPGGDFIAFGRVRDGSADLMVQPVSGGEAEVRVGGPADEGPVCWSPDGRLLAYASTAEPGVPIYLVPPHGGRPQKLVETGLAILDKGGIEASLGKHAWDPESRTLLVTRVTGSGQLAIFAVARETGEARQLTFPPSGGSDRSASYSFDGTRIVFERGRNGRGSLMTMPARGGEPEVLLADEFDNTAPEFRPDGRSVLFLSDRSAAGFEIWERVLATGELTQLTFESNDVGSFAVSAANRIAYAPFWHDTFLHIVDVSSGERHQVTSYTKDNFAARFSPDGRTIAYQSTRTGNAEIFLHPLDGGPETQVTDDPAWDVCPDWSPDGRHLIFASNRLGGAFHLFIANRDGGGQRALFDEPISIRKEYGPAALVSLVSRWSPEGARIGYLKTTQEGTSLWTVDANGENPARAVSNVVWFDWYRDSRHVICTRVRKGRSEMIAVDLATGEERFLYAGPFAEAEVAPDGRAVAFCQGRGHASMGLALLTLEPPPDNDGLPHATGEPAYLVPAEDFWHVHNGGWSPDSKRIVYTRDQDYGDLYELVEKR